MAWEALRHLLVWGDHDCEEKAWEGREGQAREMGHSPGIPPKAPAPERKHKDNCVSPGLLLEAQINLSGFIHRSASLPSAL